MLAGATVSSDSDPDDKTSPAITVGPRWMIIWPVRSEDCRTSYHAQVDGNYIMMWAGSPYAHLHVMGGDTSRNEIYVR